MADIVGYTKLVERDTDGTVAAWSVARTEVIDPGVVAHSGRIVKHTGDGFLAEFPTVKDAVTCAIQMQEGLHSSPLDFRMGINLGDVVDDGTDIHGEGVNVAARIEPLASPGGISISRSVYEQVRNQIKADFRDLGEHDVKHVSSPVRVYQIAGLTSASAPLSASEETFSVHDKSSIAVLPFVNMSGDAEQEYFADGITEDLITALSRVRMFSVLARNSTFVYKGKAVDARDVGRSLDVRYVLEGSVRRSRDRVRVTAQLIETKTGDHLWADHYDGTLDDIFDLQDRMTSTIVGTLEPEIVRAEGLRLQTKRPSNMNAYDYLLRGLAFMHKVTPEDTKKALSCFETAIGLDPKYGRAHAFASWCYRRTVEQHGLASLSEEDRRKGVDYAHTALQCDRNDPFVLLYAAATFYQIEGDFEEALALIERAISMHPYSHRFWNAKALVHSHTGDTEAAIEAGEHAISIGPNDPAIWNAYLSIAEAHLQELRYDEAIDYAKRAVRHNENLGRAYLVLAAASAHLGKTSDAHRALSKALTSCPGLTIRSLPENYHVAQLKNLEDYCDGLRKAGLPEY